MVFDPVPHLWRNPSSGFYYLVWQEGKSRKRRRSLRTKSRIQAKLLLADSIRGNASHQDRRQITLLEGAELWLEDRRRPERGLAKSTLLSYQTFLTQLKEVLPPDVLAAEVGPLDVPRLLDRFAARFDFSPQTYRKKLTVLSMVYRWMVRNELARRNPCDGVEPPSAPAQRKDATTPAGYLALRAALDDHVATARISTDVRRAEQLRDLVAVLWLSGLRSVEAHRLSWSDIDLEAQLWTIRSPKNKGGERIEPVHDDLIPLLRRRLPLGDDGPFQPEGRVRYEWRRFKKKHPGAGWDLHSLRHGFVTRLVALGRKDAAQFLAGHKTLAMTDHYTHLDAEHYREALNQL